VSPCSGCETGLPSLPFALRSATTRSCPRPPGVATGLPYAQSTAPPMARRRVTMRFAYSPPRRRGHDPFVTPALRPRAAPTGGSSPRASPFRGSSYDNWDCSKEGFEGIRAQDILPLLVQRFECEKFVGFGNVIDIFVDRCFGHNFSRDSQEDRELIDRLHAEDEAGLTNGLLTPTHMLAVFVKTLCCAPYYSRGITPVAAIRSVDKCVAI
jgi:hypothetical protein